MKHRGNAKERARSKPILRQQQMADFRRFGEELIRYWADRHSKDFAQYWLEQVQTKRTD